MIRYILFFILACVISVSVMLYCYNTGFEEGFEIGTIKGFLECAAGLTHITK